MTDKNLELFKSHLPTLKVGSENKVYPIWAAYLSSGGGQVKTASADSYICLDIDLGFKGDVNIYLLEGMINKLGIENLELSNKDQDLLVQSSGFESTLMCIDSRLPVKEMPICDMYNTEGETNSKFIDDLRLAYKFAATDGSHSHVMLTKEHIIAQSETSDPIFLARHDLSITKAVALTRNSINATGNISALGFTDDNNVVYEFGDYGFGIFSTYNIADQKKTDELATLVLTAYQQATMNEICEVGELRENTSKVLPIFYGERQNLVLMSNAMRGDNTVMNIKGQSMYNGQADLDMPTSCSSEFTILYDIQNLKNIPSTYKLGYVHNENKTDEIVCYSGNKIIVTEGEPYEGS